ncbi:MAG: DNA-binding protein WhiA [Lachnospiraceae bacterium]|nr:DNA-binding protein WhiA [Lachnospiraceae bacterium]
MSYSSDLKQELLGRFPKDRACQTAELAGIFSFLGEVRVISDSNDVFEAGHVITFRTDQTGLRDRILSLLDKLLNEKIPMDSKALDSKNRKDSENPKKANGRKNSEDSNDPKKDRPELDSILLTGPKAEKLLDILHHPMGQGLMENGLIEGWEEKRAYLRGCFLAGGSISDPNKSYHFEIAARNPAQARQIVSVMETFDLHGKTVARQGRTVVYLKESNEISDMLNIMEASVTLLDFENIRIRKDMNNAVNRKVNCETANIGKMVEAAVREVRDIKLIRDTRGLGSLSGKLRETAELRLLHPDASLLELGRMMDPPVGKSGVNHRLRRIGAVADEIRKQEENGDEKGSSCSDGKFNRSNTHCTSGTAGKSVSESGLL